MKRVVITGMGIWSCIGQDLQTVTESLKIGRSNIIFDPNRIEYGLSSGLVGNVPRPDLKPLLPRKFRATMSDDAEFAYMTVKQAFEQAHLNEDFLHEHEVGVVWGNDGNSHQVEYSMMAQSEKDSFMLGPSALFRMETSSVTMNLGSIFHLRGINVCLAAACASSMHAIGLGTIFIRTGRQKIIVVGGSFSPDKYLALPYDARKGVLSTENDTPTLASKPFDSSFQGAVQSGGAAALVLEEYEHAVARGATILAEVVGYGFSSDGEDPTEHFDGEGYCQAARRALDDAHIQPEEIDLVNLMSHQNAQVNALQAQMYSRLFAHKKAHFTCTEANTGHEFWMGGAARAVYSIIMMQNNFVAPNININHILNEAIHLKIIKEKVEIPINTALTNSSGTGGTNSALIFKKI